MGEGFACMEVEMEDEVDVASYHEASSFKKALMERFNKEQGESHQSKPIAYSRIPLKRI